MTAHCDTNARAAECSRDQQQETNEMSGNAELELRRLNEKELRSVTGGFIPQQFRDEPPVLSVQDYQRAWKTVLSLTHRA
jgi:hypothetical protein